MPPLAVFSGSGGGQKDKKTRFSSDRSGGLHTAYGDAAKLLRDKLSGNVYGMCRDTQDATPTPETVYARGPMAPPKMRGGDATRVGLLYMSADHVVHNVAVRWRPEQGIEVPRGGICFVAR